MTKQKISAKIIKLTEESLEDHSITHSVHIPPQRYIRAWRESCAMFASGGSSLTLGEREAGSDITPGLSEG